MKWVLLSILLVASVAGAAKRTKHARVAHRGELQGPVTLNLRSLDLKRRLALVEIGGMKRPPGPNFFTLTDVRGRRYVAFAARCDEPFPSGARVCELELPDGYERHKLVSVELHLGGLHSPTAQVAPAEVEATWAAAQAFLEADPPPLPLSTKDGGGAAP
jgi:hypothetical protein